GTKVQLSSAVIGDDVRLHAAVGDNPMDPVRRWHLLAHEADAGECCDQRVEGVHAVPMCHRGVGRFAPVLDAQRFHSQRLRIGGAARRRVHHHRDVDALESPAFESEDLATAAFLGRGSYDNERTLPGTETGLDAEPGGDPGDCYQVVSAAVANVRQRVVL